VGLLLSCLVGSAAFATDSCIPVYQDVLKKVDTEIVERTPDEEKMNNRVGKVVTTSAAAGATYGATTAGPGPFFIVATAIFGGFGGAGLGGLTGSFIFQSNKYDLTELRTHKRNLEASIDLLRQARAGKGRGILLMASNLANSDEVEISEAELAKVINDLDKAKTFCSEDSVDHTYRMIVKIEEEVKQQIGG
jgi:hypothetical protein